MKNSNFIYLGLHKERLSYRRSLQPSKENIQHFKLEISSLFLFLRVIFALLYPDPDPADQNPSGSETQVETIPML
jgi:hypothetical protein